MDYALIFLFVLALLVLLIAILISNSVNRAKLKVEESLSGIDVALTNRYDQITQLAQVCKSYMSAEHQTLIDSINIRQGGTISQMEEDSNQLNLAASLLRVTAEAYPELKSVALYAQLMSSINATEINLSAARRLYNSNATYFNTQRVTFPASFFARKYAAYELFQAESSKRIVPSLDL